MIRPKRMIAVTLVALFVLGGLLSSYQVVLCLATNGHVQVEFAGVSGCSDFISTSEGTGRVAGQQLALVGTSSSHCGPCVDIPIGIGDAARQKNMIVQGSPSPAKPLMAQGFSFCASMDALRQSTPAVRRASDGSLSSFRTTVLLI